MKKLLTINLALLFIVGGAIAFAQAQRPNAPSDNDDNCQRFKMRVRQAPADVDTSMLMAETDGQKLAKGKVVDPCRSANLPVRVKPSTLKPFQIHPAAPSLQLMPSPAPPLKTPSEILRDTLKPKQ